MYLRDLPGTTLADFADQVNDVSEANQVSGTEVALALTADSPTIRIGTIEVPSTGDGLEVLGRYLGVPANFLFPSQRAFDAEEAQYVLQRRLQRLGNTMTVLHNDNGIQGVYAPGQQPINPRRVVEVAMHVMDPLSPLIEYRATADEMFFDVTVPLGDVATGDPGVGDLTAAGLRFTQNRARNLAPDVNPFMYRLICTNGMSTKADLPGIDARTANTVDDVMRALEIRAEAAFSVVEQQIQHFYDLRNQPVDNPERALIRLGEEMGIGQPTLNRLLPRIPSEIPDGEQATMFHLVNLLTNEANNPAYGTRSTMRRNLEAAGGRIVTEHADRCTHCSSRLN